MDVNYHVTVCLPFKGVPYGSQECVLIETTSTCLVGSQTTCLPTNLTFVMEYGAHYLKWIDVGDALVIFSSWFLCFSLYFFFLSSSCPALHSGDSFLSCWCCCCFSGLSLRILLWIPLSQTLFTRPFFSKTTNADQISYFWQFLLV